MAIQLVNDNELVLVDDDETEAMLLRRYAARAGLSNPIRTFSSGEAFLGYLNEIVEQPERMPALVLIDVRMPTIGGFDLVRTIRQEPAYASLPVVVMFSNSDEPSDAIRAKDEGANAYVVKPTDGNAYVEFLQSLAVERPEPVGAGA